MGWGYILGRGRKEAEHRTVAETAVREYRENGSDGNDAFQKAYSTAMHGPLQREVRQRIIGLALERGDLERAGWEAFGLPEKDKTKVFLSLRDHAARRRNAQNY